MKPAKSRVLIYPARQAEDPGLIHARAALEEIEPVTKQWRGVGWGRLAGIVGGIAGALAIPAFFAVLYYGVYPLEQKQNPPLMILPQDQLKAPETPAP